MAANETADDETIDGECTPYFRVYAWSEGRTLSARDIEDIQAVLKDYNDEMLEGANAFYEGRKSGIHEVGGAELWNAVEAGDAFNHEVILKRAYARVAERQAERDKLNN